MWTLAFIALAFALFCGSIAPAAAQNFPTRPITMIVPFAAGGPTDVVGRLMAENMSRMLGESIIVEDVSGAAGTIGVGRAARAPPDGYTLSLGHWSTHVVNGAIYALPYDLLLDFEPIALLPSNPLLIVSRHSLPAKTLKELIAWIRAAPSVSVGTAGVGSGSHIAGVYFENRIETRLQFVPYRGTDPASGRSHGGADRHDVRSGFGSAAPAFRRHDQAIRRHCQDTARVGARCADGRRGGPAGFLHQHLVRAVGAQRNARPHHRQAQPRRHGGHARPGGAGALRRSRPRRSAARAADRRKRWARCRKPKS